MNDAIRVVPFTGQKVKNWIPQIADLRIEVFSEYPFLYIGDSDYEKKYLHKFLTMKDAIVIVAFDRDLPVGISTGYPFVYETKDLKRVFTSSHRDPNEYFCYGESVLRKSYRGQGIGKKFFEKREAHVRRIGNYKSICFYTSTRSLDDPRRPPDYRPLAPFWKKRGFVEHPELIGTAIYQEIGEKEQSPKQMIFWIKDLQPSSCY